MTSCPSRLELSRWEAEPEQGRPAEVRSHVASCVRCTAIFADIESSRSLLLGPDPAHASERAARAILATVAQRRDRRRWVWRFLAPALLVPATAALLLAMKPALLVGGFGGTGAEVVKGALIVETYVKRGAKVRVAADRQDFLAGDRLRFAYSSPKPGYLLVFGVDDLGKIFPYYQDKTLEGVYVEPGAKILLPGAVELDAHQGWERVFFLWSESQLADNVVRTAVVDGLAAAGNDIQHVSTLDLPVEQVSMLLRRP
jgi:hypothetical protein